MLLLHGTGWNTAMFIMTAIREKENLGAHTVVWKNNSRKDRIYFWADHGEAGKSDVAINQDMVIRAGESAIYTKAISGRTDERVCILAFCLDREWYRVLHPDPDADGMLPAFYITVEDFNRCVQQNTVRLLTAVYDSLYDPELRWEYLATMRAIGRKFPAEEIVEDERFWSAMRHTVFWGREEDSFRRLFEEPLKTADWKLMV